jgi:hypothetical protein
VYEKGGNRSKAYPNGQSRIERYSSYGKAERAFLDSKAFRTNQQRAYYNLAYIETAYRKRYDLARDSLLEALKHRNWQMMRTPATLAAYIHYNLACNRARIVVSNHQGGDPVTEKEAEEVLDSLDKACSTGIIQPVHLCRDFSEAESADLKPLYEAADTELRKKLDNLRERMGASKC